LYVSVLPSTVYFASIQFLCKNEFKLNKSFELETVYDVVHFTVVNAIKKPQGVSLARARVVLIVKTLITCTL